MDFNKVIKVRKERATGWGLKEAEIKKKIEQNDRIREEKDKKYKIICRMIIKEIDKREISTTDSEFDIKINEIIQMMLSHRSFSEFKIYETDEIKKAVKRAMNKEKIER